MSFHGVNVPFSLVLDNISLPGGSVGKNPVNAGDVDLIPGQEDPLGKEMAIHSSILVWKTPWTKEPGGQSMGSQKSQTWLCD